MSNKKYPILTLLAVLAVSLLAETAGAMPVFARKYRTGCTTCHEAFPRRNAVGRAFRLSGFRFEDDETYIKEQPVEMGDEAYERLWPKAVWPTDIPLNVPISIMSRSLIETDLDGSRKSTLSFLLPEEIELVWAGNLGKDISFYGDIIFLEKDFGGTEIQSWITLKTWIEFMDLVGDGHWLNLRLGTVGTQTMGLATALDSNNFSTHYYQYTSWMLPGVDLDAAGLSRFEGNEFSIQPQMGVEFNGRGARWAYAAGVVSGNLIAPGNEAPEHQVAFSGAGGNVDSKDFYGQLLFKFGGLPLDGTDPNRGDASPLEVSADYWRDDGLMLSFWGYRGTAAIRSWDLAGVKSECDDDFWRAGAGLQHKWGDLTLGAGAVLGSNDCPYAPLTGESVDSTAWFADALWIAYPWLMPFFRYEVVDVDLPAGVAGVDEVFEIRRVMPGVRALLRPNVAVTLEVPLYLEGEELEEGFDGTLFALLSVAF